MMDDLVKRLREGFVVQEYEGFVAIEAPTAITIEAAAALEAKDVEIARLRTMLNEVLPTDAPVWFDEAEARGWACGWNDARAQIRAPVPRAALQAKE
jgi:hypothetical protein